MFIIQSSFVCGEGTASVPESAGKFANHTAKLNNRLMHIAKMRHAKDGVSMAQNECTDKIQFEDTEESSEESLPNFFPGRHPCRSIAHYGIHHKFINQNKSGRKITTTIFRAYPSTAAQSSSCTETEKLKKENKKAAS